MKILWLCNIMLPQIAEKESKAKNSGGGWLTGLSDDLLKQPDIELIVSFPMLGESHVIEGEINNLSYFGFPKRNNNVEKYDSKVEEYLQYIIKKTSPDIIHIFGTEYPHTLSMMYVCEKLGILNKVIINIQGLVSVYENHYYAGLSSNIIGRYTVRDLIKNDNIKKQKQKFAKRGKFEKESIQKSINVIGRTDWDKACSYSINPKIKYYFCNETLRSEFYHNSWDIKKCEKYSIFASQCNYPIKGFHWLLEAMPEVLKKYPSAHIYTTGSSPLEFKSVLSKLKETSYQKYIRELIKKYNLEDKVTFLGNLDEKSMCEMFLRSNVFVSPSSIENSPNSVGEAMILGVPTIASDVGGIKSMLTHNEDGIIYQHDAHYMLAYNICQVFENEDIALKFSKNAKAHAMKTHNRDLNSKNMIDIYNRILSQI